MRCAQLERANEAEALGLGRHREAGDSPVSVVRVGHRKDRVPVGDSCVGDECLGPIEYVVIALPPRSRGHRGHVRPGLRLGHRERGHQPTLDRARNPAIPKCRLACDDERG
jgi:hypothetical protein